MSKELVVKTRKVGIGALALAALAFAGLQIKKAVTKA